MEELQYNMNAMDEELLMPDMADFLYPAFTHDSVKIEPYLETAQGPYLQIIEEPKERGFRFRYECEGPSHGGLPGASSERNRKTYPTVKVGNHTGRARVEVQLVTHTDPPRIHAHSLVGKNCNESGICSVTVGPGDLTAQFNNLGIRHVTKRGVVEVVAKRLKEEQMRQKGGRNHFIEPEEQAVLKEAKELSKSMNLNVVRLKFTAYLQDSQGDLTLALKPVISKPIYDSKSPNASNLKIARMDKTSGSVLGGEEIFLLCDKVQKDDIQVRFFEEEDGEESWEALADFSPTDVHKQYAIVFRTPPYRSADIARPVCVFLQLKRKKGSDFSEPKQFTYVPHVDDKEEVKRKRQKPLPPLYDPWPEGGAGACGRGSGGTDGGNIGFPYHPGCYNQFGGGGGFGGGGVQISEGLEQPGSALQQQLRRIALVLQSRISQGSRHMARALLEYSRTGNAHLLLAVQQQLCTIRDQNGDTPLHLAIIHQQMSVVEQLLQTFVNAPQQSALDSRNHLGQTPLHLAVITGQHAMAEILLKAGADPTLVDQSGRSAVHLAVVFGNEVMLRAVLSGLRDGHAHLLNMPDYSGLYPIHLAVRKGGERCLRMLADSGADVDARELKSGSTALHMAVQEDLFKLAFQLITELQADVNASTFSGNRPLHLAASLGLPTLCSMLTAAGAHTDVENDEPLSPCSSPSEEETEDAEESEPVGSPTKRGRRGHTAFDLAKNKRVRDLLDFRKQEAPGTVAVNPPETGKQDGPPLDSDTLAQLCGVLSHSSVHWRQLAQKLGLLTIADLFQETPSPCRSLLESYRVGGGSVEELADVLESLDLKDGARLLKQTLLRHKANETDSPATVDSGFGSQTMEELENPCWQLTEQQ